MAAGNLSRPLYRYDWCRGDELIGVGMSSVVVAWRPVNEEEWGGCREEGNAGLGDESKHLAEVCQHFRTPGPAAHEADEREVCPRRQAGEQEQANLSLNI
jgi:hypothetical protein